MRTSDLTGKQIAMLVAAGSVVGFVAALLIPGEINLIYAIVIAAISGLLVGTAIDFYNKNEQ